MCRIRGKLVFFFFFFNVAVGQTCFEPAVVGESLPGLQRFVPVLFEDGRASNQQLPLSAFKTWSNLRTMGTVGENQVEGTTVDTRRRLNYAAKELLSLARITWQRPARCLRHPGSKIA